MHKYIKLHLGVLSDNIPWDYLPLNDGWYYFHCPLKMKNKSKFPFISLPLSLKWVADFKVAESQARNLQLWPIETYWNWSQKWPQGTDVIASAGVSASPSSQLCTLARALQLPCSFEGSRADLSYDTSCSFTPVFFNNCTVCNKFHRCFHSDLVQNPLLSMKITADDLQGPSQIMRQSKYLQMLYNLLIIPTKVEILKEKKKRVLKFLNSKSLFFLSKYNLYKNFIRNSAVSTRKIK